MMGKPARVDGFALVLSFLAVLLSAWVAYGIYDGLAQLEDEYAYQWQARLSTSLKLKIPSPSEPQEFVIPFVIDQEGERFGKYPLGWPIVLSVGERFHLARWINPLLAGLAVWLTYQLGKTLLGDRVGLLAAGLTVISPLFLTYSGSILSHTWGLVLALSLAVAWLALNHEEIPKKHGNLHKWGYPVLAGLSLGVLGITRPWTAVGVALPFGVHGIIQLFQATPIIKRRILLVGMVAVFVASLHFAWQFSLTGDFLGNPYLLWWPYDRIGFGPGTGLAEGGHSLKQAWVHTRHSLEMTFKDLWGWGIWVWLLPLAGLWAARRNFHLWLIASVFPSLVLVYGAYWVSGPRYYYESLFSLTISSAGGIAWLAGWLPNQLSGKQPVSNRWNRLRQGAVVMLLIGLVLLGTARYGPARIQAIKDRYGFSQAALAPFRTEAAARMTPALVVVHTQEWWDYGVYLHLQDPTLTSSFIFAWAPPKGDPSDVLARYYPDREIFHYYPDQPGEFYRNHLP